MSKFIEGDYIKSNREGTIGYETIQKVIGYSIIVNVEHYILEREDSKGSIMSLSKEFVNKNYNKAIGGNNEVPNTSSTGNKLRTTTKK